MAECNLVGGPPHTWAPYGPVDAKCQRCGVQQNWHGVWDSLMAELARLRRIESAARNIGFAIGHDRVVVAGASAREDVSALMGALKSE